MKTRQLLLLSALVLVLTGCAFPVQYPIENVQNILVAGVDTEDGQVKLTVAVDKIEPGGKAGEESTSMQLYTATGATIFEAKRALHTFAEKRTSWYHLKYIVIGESAAKQDIGDVLDFFCENDENRFLHRLIVSKGMSASDFLTTTVAHKGGFANYLDSLFDQAKQTGQASEVRLLDYAGNCECPWISLFIPTIQIIPATQHSTLQNGKTETEIPGFLIQLSGYAIFNKNRLAGYLDAQQAMGLNIAINRINNPQITVVDMRGQPVSLEVVSCKARINTEMKDGLPFASIDVVLDTFLVEYHETSEAARDQYIFFLEEQQSTSVMSMVSAALTEAKRYGADVFGISDSLYHSNTVASEKLRQNWEACFSAMDISVNVTSSIQCTYSMLNAPG